MLHPSYFHVFYRNADGRWGRVRGDSSIRLNSYPDLPLDQAEWNLKTMYDISDQEIYIELFRINGGRAGYYLANLWNRKYYYCGLEYSDVIEQLHELGFGLRSRPD
jgi:hypothetical protein